MKNLFFCLLILFLSITTYPDTTKILPLGNSITSGWAEGGYNSYRRPLWKKLHDSGYTNIDFIGSMTLNNNGPAPDPDFDLDHEGHFGWRCDWILEGTSYYPEQTKLSTWLQSYTPDIVLMHLGTNDANEGNDDLSTISELSQIVSLLRQDNPNVIILFAKLIPIKEIHPGDDPWDPQKTDLQTDDRLNSLNSYIPNLVESLNNETSPVILVDHNTDFDTSAYYADPYHPNEAGENEMARRWYEALVPFLDHTQIEICSNNYNNQKNISIFPNPFNPSTRISLFLNKKQHANISIYSSNGTLVKHISSSILGKGWHNFNFTSMQKSSALYFIKIKTANHTSVKKALLIK